MQSFYHPKLTYTHLLIYSFSSSFSLFSPPIQLPRMKISYHWLKEIIKSDITVEKTAELLTGCGLEVESVEPYESLKGALKGIKIGEVKTCIKHPNADKLSLTTVDVGGENLLQIVCGAPNVAAGQKVLVATVGTTIYPTKGDPFEIKKSKIRGEFSEGMICAEDELGMGTSHDGIMVLPSDYIVGKDAIHYFSVYTDYLIEIGLTANRGDAASHLGVARDLKALGVGKVKAYSNKIDGLTSNFPIEVSIEDTQTCKRYSGVLISGITIKDSPDWLKNKLKVIGINPINNIVDATNYVLHEMGQPLHAFDADKIAGDKIIVRNGFKGTVFTTLDKTERKLTAENCMICDAEKPLAIAGVFGGLDSGITSETKNIFIESAYFDAASIRKTARQHGLSTDASFRYERGTDPNITVSALARIVPIILEIAGGKVSSGLTDLYPEKVANTEIHFSFHKLNQLLGQEIPATEVKRILADLDIITLNEQEGNLLLSVPPFRVDIKRQADVAEEIVRIYGLNNIAIPSQLKSVLTRSADEDAFILRNQISDFLSHNGFFEILCNSLTKSAYYPEEELNNAVRILNPLSSDLDIMRLSMLYNGLEMLQYNANRKSKQIKAYEFGNTYQTSVNGYIETPHFSLFITGSQQKENWQQPQQDSNYYAMKDAVEKLLHRAGIGNLQFEYSADTRTLTQYTKVLVDQKEVAVFGCLLTEVCNKFDLDQSVFYADIFWNQIKTIKNNRKTVVKPLSNFPSVRRDLALVLDQHVKYADLEKKAFQTAPDLIKEVNVFDVYQGDKIEKGKKSYALSFILLDENKTLTDIEIDSVMQKLIKGFEKDFGAVLRH